MSLCLDDCNGACCYKWNLWVDHVERPEGPCSALDRTTGRCKYYDYRPDACRDFEVDGVKCWELRKEYYQIGAPT